MRKEKTNLQQNNKQAVHTTLIKKLLQVYKEKLQYYQHFRPFPCSTKAKLTEGMCGTVSVPVQNPTVSGLLPRKVRFW